MWTHVEELTRRLVSLHIPSYHCYCESVTTPLKSTSSSRVRVESTIELEKGVRVHKYNNIRTAVDGWIDLQWVLVINISIFMLIQAQYADHSRTIYLAVF
jgi:hypothetical protein